MVKRLLRDGEDGIDETENEKKASSSDEVLTNEKGL